MCVKKEILDEKCNGRLLNFNAMERISITIILYATIDFDLGFSSETSPLCCIEL
jgi:hypothetical protein